MVLNPRFSCEGYIEVVSRPLSGEQELRVSISNLGVTSLHFLLELAVRAFLSPVYERAWLCLMVTVTPFILDSPISS